MRAEGGGGCAVLRREGVPVGCECGGVPGGEEEGVEARERVGELRGLLVGFVFVSG